MKKIGILIALLGVSWGTTGIAVAQTPGVTATEIKLGQTKPYSGPASGYGIQGKAESAYFQMINDQGGVNGRKINLISLDDAYSPPKTVEQTRRLVEQDEVAAIFGTLGSPTNSAIKKYLNGRKIPQLFIVAGASAFADPEHFPWRYRAYGTISTKRGSMPPTFSRQHRTPRSRFYTPTMMPAGTMTPASRRDLAPIPVKSSAS